MKNMTPKRLALLLLALAFVCWEGWNIYRDILTEPNSKYAYAFLFLTATLIVTLISVRTTRTYIAGHVWAVRAVGGSIGLLGIVVIAMEQSPSQFAMWLGLGPIFLGFMVALMPNMVRDIGPLNEFLRRLR